MSPRLPVTTARIKAVTKQNLFRDSENIGSHTLTNATVTSNAGIAPDGALTADIVLDDTTDNLHCANLSITNTGNEGIYCYSVFVKRHNMRYAAVQIANSGGANRYTVVVDLDNGTLVNSTVSGTPLNTTATISPVGNGWYRVALTLFIERGFNVFGYVCTCNSATPTWFVAFPRYTGTGTGVYVWGTQLVKSNHAGDYTPTVSAIDNGGIRKKAYQVQNLVFNGRNMNIVTNNFGLNGTTINSSAYVDSIFGEPMFNVVASAADIYHSILSQSLTILKEHFNINELKTYSYVARANGFNFANIFTRSSDRSGTGRNDSITVNLTTGAVVYTSNESGTMTYNTYMIGSDCYIEMTTQNFDSVQFGPLLAAGPQINYLGDGVKGILMSAPCIRPGKENYKHFTPTFGSPFDGNGVRKKSLTRTKI